MTSISFQTFSIGKRLSGCFAVIFALCLFSSLLGVWQMRQFSAELRTILNESVRADQTATDLYTLLALGVQRTTAIARSSDSTLADFFAPGIPAAAKRGGELSGRLKELLVRPAEVEAYRKTLPLRDTYYKYRDEIMALKKAGRTADAERLLTDTFLPASTAYLDQLRVVVEMQRKDVEAATQSIEADVRSSTALLIASCVGALATGLLLAWRLTLSITRPLDRARGLAERVAALDLRDTPDDAEPSNDEIGALRRALAQMRSHLRATVEHVNTVTDGIATASNEIAVGNLDLSQRTELAAGKLQQAASTMEELTGTVRQTAGSASTANELAASAQGSAANGGSVVSQVTTTMRQIDEASARIAEIVGVIDGIAFQTNILALNAAVEAARAGDSGRGFAVVASEVRSLAVRSAAAAKEVKSLIGVSVERVAAGTRLVDDAERAMGEIVASVRRVSEVIGEIAAAADAQSQGLGQVNGAVAQLDHMTQQNAALVEQSTAATENLKGQAAALAGSVRQFRW